MSGVFQYRPRFVDIRVRPPRPEEEEADVLKLRPGEKPCEWPGCSRAGECRAPRSRDLPGEYYLFCPAHTSEYNRNWNFFSGMTEGEVRRRLAEEQATGGRPTWTFKASARSREAAAFAARARSGQGVGDPFGVFGDRAPAAEPEPRRRLGKLERQALADLDLDDDAQGARIRARYAELLKLCHPDANGGDRSAEGRMQRVIRAYKILRKAGLV